MSFTGDGHDIESGKPASVSQQEGLQKELQPPGTVVGNGETLSRTFAGPSGSISTLLHQTSETSGAKGVRWDSNPGQSIEEDHGSEQQGTESGSGSGATLNHIQGLNSIAPSSPGDPSSADLRRRNLSSAKRLSSRREAASEVVKLLDPEIEALWKYTYRIDCLPNVTDEVSRWKLVELAEKFWTEDVIDITSRLDRAKEGVSSANNGLYQIVGFYSVFQGILFGAASQTTTTLTCSSWPILVVLSVITTVYSLIGYFLKFLEYRGKLMTVADYQAKRNQRKNQISTLRQKRIDYKFPTPKQYERRPNRIVYFVIFIAFLFFSIAISACIHLILCPSDKGAH